MKNDTGAKVVSSFIACTKHDCFKCVDACKQKKCANKCAEFRKYEHGNAGALSD